MILIAFERGYKIIDGELYNTKTGNKLKSKLKKQKCGYKTYVFTLSLSKYYKPTINVHRLVAYQKFGNKMFEEGIEVRHLDGDSLNNKEDNIALGTKSENAMDKDPKVRLSAAITASTKNRKFTDKKMEEIRLFYNKGGTYKTTMEKFNITSKGTLHYILNTKYQTKIGE